jgi:DNA-binding transcriptional MerR regulator
MTDAGSVDAPSIGSDLLGHPAAAVQTLTIGALCRELQGEFPEISISKIRYLEDQKLLQPRRTPSGYRLYSEADAERLRTVLRLQRDEFLPLRVIRQELERGTAADLDGRRPDRRRRSQPPDETAVFDRAAVVEATGADEEFLGELIEYGIVKADAAGTFSRGDAEIVQICATLAEYGLGPRHVRQLQSLVDRAAGLFQGVVAPSLRSGNPQRREQGAVDLRILAQAAADLTERMLVRDLSR